MKKLRCNKTGYSAAGPDSSIKKKKQKRKKPADCSAGSSLKMAVREGFEPSMHFRAYTLSRRAPSATRTSHRGTVRCVDISLQRGATIGEAV